MAFADEAAGSGGLGFGYHGSVSRYLHLEYRFTVAISIGKAGEQVANDLNLRCCRAKFYWFGC